MQLLKKSRASLDVLPAEEYLDTRLQTLVGQRPAPKWKTAATRVQPLRVLLVEDDRQVARLLSALLRSDGHDVHLAHDGVAALTCVRAYRPEVVLLDIELPGMSGYEVACRLRAREDTKDIFLAAVTGHGQNEDRDRSQEVGFDCHLVKPVDPVDLRRLLASVANDRKEVL